MIDWSAWRDFFNAKMNYWWLYYQGHIPSHNIVNSLLKADTSNPAFTAWWSTLARADQYAIIDQVSQICFFLHHTCYWS